MPICGFCKNRSLLKISLREWGEPKIRNGITIHLKSTVTMFNYPQCDIVLGLGIFKFPR